MYLKKADVLDSIKSRVQKIHGVEYTIYEVYLGTNPFTKKPVRKAAKSEEKLKQKIADFYKKLNYGGEVAVMLDANQSLDARAALDILARAGLNITLAECARRIADDPGVSVQCTTTLREAYDRYYDQQSGKSESHLKSVRFRVGVWVAKFGGERLLSEVTAKNLSEYLESTFLGKGSEEKKTTYNNNLNYIKTFMSWCAAPEQGYIKESPVATMKKKTKGYVDPEYMKPEDVRKLFDELARVGGPDLAYAILSFFCGMRQDEIIRSYKGEKAIVIDLKEKYIRVVECKGSTRGIKPRAFTIPEQALAWMQSMPDFLSAVRTKNRWFREHLVDIARKIGVKLPKNAGRHTFCTMFEAAHHDSNALSAIVGNTEDIRDRHYNGVAKPQEGRDYFTILPKTAGTEASHPEKSPAGAD